MSKRIYKTRPLSYRQWRQIKKEMYRLALSVAALVLFEQLVHLLATWIIAQTV